jgi:organic hydroperoxide reductase OsmC/OhrA
MSEEKTFKVDMTREDGFVFKVDFGLDGVEPLVMDEPAPLGGELGPNASKVLAATVGNCLCASLLFCLQKSKVDVSGMKATVDGVTARNQEGRWRIREMNVEISPEVSEGSRKKLGRCVELFESFCIVSQSIEQGIPINIRVRR